MATANKTNLKQGEKNLETKQVEESKTKHGASRTKAVQNAWATVHKQTGGAAKKAAAKRAPTKV